MGQPLDRCRARSRRGMESQRRCPPFVVVGLTSTMAGGVLDGSDPVPILVLLGAGACDRASYYVDTPVLPSTCTSKNEPPWQWQYGRSRLVDGGPARLIPLARHHHGTLAQLAPSPAGWLGLTWEPFPPVRTACHANFVSSQALATRCTQADGIVRSPNHAAKTQPAVQV